MSSKTRGQTVVQEPEGLASGKLAWLGLVAIVVSVASFLLVWWLLPPELMGMPVVPKEPDQAISGVEQSDIESTARGVRETEQARGRLDQYGWADQPAGVAIIPVDRAIELYVEQREAKGSTP